jgi:TetR/AcrR family transcriptional repressor of mexJK operon
MIQDKKREAIIEAAKKRFSHFGVGKTTMNEIADDLSISKASLYYYFPDKLNLYAAVLQTIIESEQAREPDFLKEKDLQKALTKFLESRTESIIRNHNIIEYLRTIGTSFPPELEKLFTLARTRDIKVVATIISNGIKAQGAKTKNAQKLAELLIDCFEGLRNATFNPRTNFSLEKAQFYEVLKREKELAVIFANGLTT